MARIDLPEAQVGGAFASGVRVGFNKWGFVLDFIVHDDRVTDDEAYLVVERVRLDPSAVQSVLEVLSGKLDEYEGKFGDPRA
ncbi:MAG TPA: DUF3467 domain-containing protein [Jatrophihabitans sp.]|nr:DUF3467 domain-containing protein [Jatrophihabitans sp.]